MSVFTTRPAKWFYSRVRSRNIFKQSVSLTYKDKAHYLNFFGGISTILIVIFIIIYGTIMMIRLRARTDVQWNQNHIEVDTKTDNQTYTVTEGDEIELRFYLNEVGLITDLQDLMKVLEISAVVHDLESNTNTTLEKIDCSATSGPDAMTDNSTYPGWCYSIKNEDFVRKINKPFSPSK